MKYKSAMQKMKLLGLFIGQYEVSNVCVDFGVQWYTMVWYVQCSVR